VGLVVCNNHSLKTTINRIKIFIFFDYCYLPHSKNKKTIMKKIIGLLTVAVLVCCTTVIAQPPGGGQQMSPEQRTAMMKERLKPAGLTDVQTDSAIAVLTDRSYMSNMGNMREMAPEERQAKMKEINDARAKRLEKSIGAELTKKVMEIMSQRGPGGGGRGGGQ
jgi:hypothetical protein